MISEESFKLFSYVVRFGHWSRLFPYKWNASNYHLEVVPNLNRWHLIGVATLLAPWIFVGILLAGLIASGSNANDVVFFTFLTLDFSFATIIQVCNLFH